ncbi:MAG: hypothetical protein A2681_02370 [Candidatus Liptonbacteria bacterium RIFCSPHIGHO2_01_FULL_56_18b]|nr:MAG: hypothetical protein A2681_02370 [Candidatus Liptonbacteria bacterium RIFCSPHIGHO2_01_FULL_56_18b]
MSELRQDLVSGDWIVVASERAKRPHDFLPKKRHRRATPKKECPFEDLEASGNWPPIISYPDDTNPDARMGRGSGRKRGSWQIAVIPNKYPAVTHAPRCAVLGARGPYRLTQGVGHHDLVLTRDHRKNLAHLTPAQAIRLFEVIQKRYQALGRDACLHYTSMFFNWGASAGASLFHPHYQLLTLPIIPPDVAHSLQGSHKYFRQHRRCVHCDILGYERKEGSRIIEENAGAIAIAPFVSREAFEVRVYPKRHRPYFEATPLADLRAVVTLLASCLRRIERHLNDPDLNFFIHTAPIKNQNQHRHYHWHIEIVPKISIPAGFELSTGVLINVIDPDKAASILRGAKK